MRLLINNTFIVITCNFIRQWPIPRAFTFIGTWPIIGTTPIIGKRPVIGTWPKIALVLIETRLNTQLSEKNKNIQ
jgi:hypothetical protein